VSNFVIFLFAFSPIISFLSKMKLRFLGK
jgi:hypothetical protein